MYLSSLFFDTVKLSLFIICGYAALNACAGHTRYPWIRAAAARRFAVLAMLTVLIVGIKVFEDVIGKESGPVDTAILWFIQLNLPPGLLGFFSIITVSGAGDVLVPATVIMCSWFLLTRHRREAALLAASMVGAWVCIYTLKALVGLSRLVLGTHWPTHVLAAVCLGVFIPLSISVVLDFYQHRLARS